MYTLEQCIKNANNYFSVHGQPTEYDKSINDTSRETIEAMHHENGECWLGKINLYDEDPKPFKLIQWKGEKVYNFEYAFILPKQDTEIETMINDRANAPYNAIEDIKRINKIMARVGELNGILLYWS